VNGGHSILINPHMKTLDRPELAGYRGQSYAVDWVKVDGWGRRASGILPDALGDYFIFGEPVYAPCSGAVRRIENALPDHRPGDPEHVPPAGNFVLLECGGAQVLLAHLMAGSVTVGAGDAVQAGQPIGRVGNSGRSTEPHLHVHAQRPSADGSLNAEPLPVSVDGRVPVRGSRLRPPPVGGPGP
jgi:murein DD-endopeptidase MepM/ murein hydrolase activator NlpD